MAPPRSGPADKKPATLKDVAREAGVSYQTVSRAVNGFPEVSVDTATRIREIASRLGYSPNRLAGSLRTSRSKVIGLCLSDIENNFFAEIASAVESEAAARGYSVLLVNSGEDIQRERRAIASLVERRVDGLIVAPAEGDHSYLRDLLPARFPLVAVNRTMQNFGSSAVLTENEAGAKSAVQYLVSLGHERIGAVVGSLGLLTGRERLAGFNAALRENGLPLRREWIGAGGLHCDGARKAATRMLSQKDRPTAVFCSSNKISEGVLLALSELRLKRGRDIEVIGFDNTPWVRLVDPPFPIVTQQTDRMGKEAVGLLLAHITGEITGSRTVRLPTRLIVEKPVDFDFLDSPSEASL